MIPFALKCDLVARQERIELIRAVIVATRGAIKYIDRATLCPVCLLAGLQSVLTVGSTQGETRFCTCSVCGATIQAIGEPAKPKAEKQPDPKKKPVKGKKRKKL